MIRKRQVLAGLCALGLAFASASCSSSKKASTTPTSSSPSSSAQPTGTQPTGTQPPSGQATGSPIKVGMLCTCSGAGGFGAFILPAKSVYQAWVKAVNASGGINGHQIQLIVEDDTGNPGTAVSNAQTLISDHVIAIADVSILDQAFASAVQAANIPVVGVETPNAPFGSNPDFYPEAQTNASATAATVQTAKLAGATNIGDVYCAESPICAQSVPIFRTTGQQQGVPLTYNAEVAATAPNYTAQCVAAQQQHVSSLFIGDASAVIARIATDCARQNFNPTYITQGAGFGMVEASTPGLKDHLWNEFQATPFFATNVAAVKAANAAIEKYSPGLQGNANLYNETDFMAWTSGVLLAHAIKAGGLTATATPTAAEVVQGLLALKGDTLDGLTVPLTFTAGQPHNISCWFTARVQNGVPSLVNNGQTTCINGSSS
jgi:branched-chain amino acid transport system substrate-binding protein